MSDEEWDDDGEEEYEGDENNGAEYEEYSDTKDGIGEEIEPGIE
jgi:hypothetical protein